MNTPSLAPIHSAGIRELNDLFNDLRRPCGTVEVLRFKRAYRRLYPHLNRAEGRFADKLVAALRVDLERDELASLLADLPEAGPAVRGRASR
jgi:hypothetical protein